tara:strand:+ start:144 stop:530 length:387 start_codon:yes stop_codon:yes gene_type:complete
METTEMLQTKIKELQSEISNLTCELQREEKALEVVNKPTMSENVYSLLQDSIRNVIDDTEFSSDDFDVELRMEYDNTVQIENLIFNSQDSMVDDIIRCIDKEFRVIENEEVDVMGELDENGNHYSKLV